MCEAKFTIQGLEIEIVMLYTPKIIFGKVLYDQSVTTEIRHVNMSIIAIFFINVDNVFSKKTVGRQITQNQINQVFVQKKTITTLFKQI